MLAAPRTQIGPLVFGKDADTPEPVQKDAYSFVGSNLVFPKPLPWVAAPQGNMTIKAPDEVPLPDVDQGKHQVAARISAFEQRLDGFESQAGLVRKLEEDVSAFRKVFDERCYADAQRINALEAQTQQSQLHETYLTEQLVNLQAEFRDFTSQSLSRQLADHVDVEGQVAHALAKQKHATEDWRFAARQKDAQLQSELEALNSSVEEVRERLLTSQAELRIRLTALEAPGLAAGANRPGLAERGLDGVHVAQVDFLKEHMERLQKGSVQAGASLSELQARLEGETAARASAQQEQNTRLEALGQALGLSRALMAQSIAQRVEALEERIGMEKKDIIARQSRLRDEIAQEGQEGVARLQEVSSRFVAAVDSLEKRCQVLEASKMELEAQLADVQKARRSDAESMKGAVVSTTRKAQEQFERQAETVRTLKTEVDAVMRHMRDMVAAEHAARLQDEKKLCDDVMEAIRVSTSSSKKELQLLLKKQAEVTAVDMERCRRVNADRAERLSRYVDAALRDAGVLVQGAGGQLRENMTDARVLKDLKDQVLSMQKEINQQVQSSAHKHAELADEMKSKLQRITELLQEEAKSHRRETEKVARDVERKALGRQEELQSRFETYVRHFDSSIHGIQAAVLRPWQEPPRPAVVHSLPGVGLPTVQVGTSPPSLLRQGHEVKGSRVDEEPARQAVAHSVPALGAGFPSAQVEMRSSKTHEGQDMMIQETPRQEVTQKVIADLWRRLATLSQAQNE